MTNALMQMSTAAHSELSALRERLSALEVAIANESTAPAPAPHARMQMRGPGDTLTLLRGLLEGTIDSTGDEFFRALVRHLASTLKVRDAFVAEVLETEGRVRTLAYWSGDGYVDNVELDVADTPCERVLQGESAFFPERVAEHFPRDAQTIERLGIESYLAIPMTDRNGRVIGHLAAMDDAPMDVPEAAMWVFKAFGSRAAAELARQRTEAALAQSRARLAGVFDCAMDAIIGIDSTLRITLFNQAAEEVFRCTGAQVIGTSFERFASERFARLIRESIQAFERSGWRKHFLWAQGLAAFRGDGDAFPADVSLSPFAVGRERHVAIILRDALIRLRAESDMERLRDENVQLQGLIDSSREDSGIIAVSAPVQKVLDAVERVAATSTTALIIGETGTGKELIARAVHRASPRRDKPLVKVNCAALTPSLIESELLGHERGAFTGAHARKLGRFELANGGTLFLDEIGELPLDLQAKLLRVLQEGELERVGGTASIRVDVRIIAATNRDLEKCVEEGSFRQDLYYRLNVFPLRVPPLRERPEDIEVLIRHFVAKFGKQIGRPIRAISRAVIDALTAYEWPGNVRELEHVIERAVILAPGDRLELGDWQPRASSPRLDARTDQTLEAVERAHILCVLDKTAWQVSGQRGAARILGLKPTTLESRMKKLGIRRSR
ncbi:MAG: sigma 54-interacting transcriptional regulator [Thiohalocapsa sp.]|nr:sigma 54-interacting transcriptional regulator [Thiohalocapsa sp.]MCF7989210.1 sigma 54-interacting transcriptional regulator [Thiohalocapsa sp.]